MGSAAETASVGSAVIDLFIAILGEIHTRAFLSPRQYMMIQYSIQYMIQYMMIFIRRLLNTLSSKMHITINTIKQHTAKMTAREYRID